MRVLELFCGAGGAYQGLHQAGWEHLACLDFDPNPIKALQAAGAPAELADLSEPDTWSRLGERFAELVDAVWSSFPCQAFSQAGKRLGARDERNGWPWTVGVLDAVRPTWFLGENVAGLTHHSGECQRDPMRCPGCYLAQVVLVDLRQRFEWVGYAVLDSADYGIPQHRRRVYIVAGPRPIRWPKPTHGPAPEQRSLFSAPIQRWVSVREALNLKDQQMIGGGRNPQSPELADLRSYRNLTEEPCVTLAASQVGNRGPFIVAAGSRNRKLTPKECRILMGWAPEWDQHLGSLTKGAQYKAIGNGCTPEPVRSLALAIDLQSGADQ